MPSHFEVISQLVADKEALQEEVRRLRKLVTACDRYTSLLHRQRTLLSHAITSSVYEIGALNDRVTEAEGEMRRLVDQLVENKD